MYQRLYAKPFYGFPVSEHVFSTFLPFHAVGEYAHDPRIMAKRGRHLPPATRELQDIHNEIQRAVAGAKKQNMQELADQYIPDMVIGKRNAYLPEITLYTDQKLEMDDGNDPTLMRQIYLPSGVKLLAIDGESQLGAWFIVADRIKENTHDSYWKRVADALENWLIPIMLCYGNPILWAKQAFHDLNTKAVVLKPNLALAMDQNDPCKVFAQDMLHHIPAFSQPNSIVQATDIYTFVRACIGGAKAAMNKRLDFDQELFVQQEEKIRRILEIIGQVGFEWCIRPKTLLFTQQVLCVFGALWHDGKISAETIGKMISEVDWNRSDHWVGVALTQRPNGTYALTGATAGNVLMIRDALINRESPSYHKIRQ